MALTDGTEAKLEYLPAEFRIIRPGDWVPCAVTGQAIPVNDLKYWNAERQEAYVDAAAGLVAHQRATKQP